MPLFKHSSSSQKLPSKILQFYWDILHQFPNVIVSIAELHALRPHPDQWGPIKHIQPPVDGMVCTLCDFTLPSNVMQSTWWEHWMKHEISSKKNKLHHSLEAKIQSFHYDSNHCLNFAVPVLDPLPSIAKPYTAGVTTLLASQLHKLMANPRTGRAMEPKAILPFFQHIGAANYIKAHEALALTYRTRLQQYQ
jgi:hypothetical protein